MYTMIFFKKKRGLLCIISYANFWLFHLKEVLFLVEAKAYIAM